MSELPNASIPPIESPPSGESRRLLLLIVIGAALLLGTFLRFSELEGAFRLGFDESYYVRYAMWHSQNSLADFSSLCSEFYKEQTASPLGLPSPLRMLFPYLGMLVHKATGMTLRDSLITASAMASALMLWISTLAAYRMFNGGIAALASILLAVSINQLHQSQRIMVDCILGSLAMIALWALWEIGNGNRRPVFWILYVLSLFLAVFVKEGAFYVYAGFGVVIVAGTWLKAFKHPPRGALVATFGAGAAAFTVLCLLSGGFERFFDIYSAVVAKSVQTPYVIATGDGPWYRYWVDSLMAQPLVTILAIGGMMHLPFSDSRVRYLVLFVIGTFAIMCQIKYAQYFRYAVIWDLSLRILASLQLFHLCKRIPRVKTELAAAVAVVAIALHEFGVYWQICVVGRSYALESIEILQNLNMYRPF
jgi:hypothetical protein